MGTPQSPSRIFNGLDEESYSDAKFAHEINDKMRVPKRIKATGECSDEDLLLSNQSCVINSWNYRDKIDMNVPDRIIVLGHDQHLETRSAPREILLENSILPQNPSEYVRVKTPPRVITLDEHNFTNVNGGSPDKIMENGQYYDEDLEYDEDGRPPPYVRANGIAHAKVGFQTNDTNSIESDSQLTTGGSKRSEQPYNNNEISMISQRDGTPIGDLTPHEEILYLRRQLAKLNRRVLNIEINNEQRLQREKIVYCLGIAYFVLKALLWLNRN